MRAHERPRREKVTLSTPLYVSTETLGLLLLRSLPHELMHPPVVCFTPQTRTSAYISRTDPFEPVLFPDSPL